MPGIQNRLTGSPDACWTDTAPETSYPELEGTKSVDVAVVGAGIVGATAAHLLIQDGCSVALLESRRIGRQVTGRSTAKITTQHSLIYKNLIAALGFDQAKQYADANVIGMDQIRRWVETLSLECDFGVQDAYVYCNHPSRIEELIQEADASHRLGLDADVLSGAPVPFETAGALRCRNQAQFNPTKYLVSLARAIEPKGALVFEQTRVTTVEHDDDWTLKTPRASLRAKHVVLATNFPIAGSINYDRQAKPRYHVAMAFRTASAAPIEGMLIGIDHPTHSLRLGRDRKGPLLIVLGPKFGTGLVGNVAERFRELEAWVRQHFEVTETAWRWGNEDYETADRVPIVGEAPRGSGLYIATGFNGWGISNGTAAGIAIARGIMGQAPQWAAVYDPTRQMPDDFNSGGDSQTEAERIEQIAPGEGAVVKLGEEDLAVWKDRDGTVHVLSASCTHEGCIVTWNNAERTWDCPCHGSMFSAEGEVIHGPAVAPLPPRQLQPASDPRSVQSELYRCAVEVFYAHKSGGEVPT